MKEIAEKRAKTPPAGTEVLAAKPCQYSKKSKDEGGGVGGKKKPGRRYSLCSFAKKREKKNAYSWGTIATNAT